jgi:hypothetical protein
MRAKYDAQKAIRTRLDAELAALETAENARFEREKAALLGSVREKLKGEEEAIARSVRSEMERAARDSVDGTGSQASVAVWNFRGLFFLKKMTMTTDKKKN